MQPLRPPSSLAPALFCRSSTKPATCTRAWPWARRSVIHVDCAAWLCFPSRVNIHTSTAKLTGGRHKKLDNVLEISAASTPTTGLDRVGASNQIQCNLQQQQQRHKSQRGRFRASLDVRMDFSFPAVSSACPLSASTPSLIGAMTRRKVLAGASPPVLAVRHTSTQGQTS